MQRIHLMIIKIVVAERVLRQAQDKLATAYLQKN